ncbi:MAG: GAF domain-containing protein [Chloroflexota bacterium]
MTITETSRPLTATSIPVWRQLRWNLVGFAVALVLIPVLIVGIVVLQQTRTQTLTQINYQLDSVTTLKQNQLQRWLNTSNQVLDVFLSDRARFDLLTRFTASTPEQQAITNEGVNSVLTNGVKSQGENDAAFKEFFLYDTQGRIIASSAVPQIGKVVNRQPYFKPSLVGNYIQTPYYDVGSTELTMFITRPLISTTGEIVGAMAGRLDLTTLGNIMTERTGLGESGETYLISIENNYFLTPSRFQNIDQKRAYHTEGIDKALSGENGFSVYPAYRGISVLGQYRWIPELKAAFLAEIDESEALTLYNQTLSVGLLVLILATLGATLVAFYNANRVSKPISALTDAALQLAKGDFTQRANVNVQNEIGILASTFNSMSDQLQNLVGTLEERVNARTRDLQIVANVSKSATTILNLDDLLQSVVDLTKQSFDLYHAHIYLLDDTGENLVLTAGAGEPGRIMKQQGRRIALNNSSSLVARAGRTRKGVIENDVTKARDFLANPLLPNTKSELAVPMVVANRLVGVLDVQADYANRFTDEDVAVQTSLGDQIAVAVQNARAFADVQNAEAKARANEEELIEAQRIARVGRWTWVPATGEVGWNDMMYEHFGEPHHMQPNFDLFLSHIYPDDAPGIVKIMEDAIQSGAPGFIGEYRVVRTDGQLRYHAAIGGITRDENGVAIHLVGTAQDITDRKGAEVERQIAFDTANRLNNSRGRQEVLEAVNAYGRDRGAYNSLLLYIDTDADNTPEWAEVTGAWSINGVSTTPVGTRFYLPDLPFAKLWMLNTSEPLFVENVMTDPRVDETTRGILQRTGGGALAILPMTVQGRWIGLFTFSWSEPIHFTDADNRIFTSIMQQATATVDALRSAEETSIALEKTEALYLGSERISNAATIEDALNAFIESTDLKYFDIASLLVYDKIWDATIPKTNTRLAEWTRDGKPSSVPLGTVYTLESFPIFKLLKRDDAFIINDAATNPGIDENTRHLLTNIVGIKSIVIYPMVANNQWYGVLTAQSKEIAVINEEQAKHIMALIGQVANVIQNIRLIEQTQKRAAELATVAKVSATATSVLEVNELLQSVVDLAKEAFGLYHAHIYLLDDAGERLILASGAGDAGRIMKERGRAILLSHPNSLVARAGRTQQGTIANDVTNDPDFLPNPLLPNTKSEMAVPLIVGNKLIGVLDVQADVINRFSQDDVTIQATLAAQIAVAVENARAFTRIQETEGAVREREQRYQQILDGVRDLILVKGEKSRVIWANKAFRDYYGMTQTELQGMIDAPLVEPDFTQQYIVDDAYVFDNGATLEIPEEPIKRYDGDVRLFQTVKTPIFDEEGKVFLTVGVSRDITDRKESELERQIVYEASSLLNEAQEREQILGAILPYAQRSGIISGNLLYVDVDSNNQPEWAELVAEWTNTGKNTTPIGSRFYLPEFTISKLWMSSPNEPLLIGDLSVSPAVDETTRKIMQMTGVKAMAILPMVTQGRWIAFISFSWPEVVQFSDQDRRVYVSMMQQATASVDALRSAEQTQVALKQTEILYAGGERVNHSHTLSEVLAAVIESTALKQVDRATLLFFDRAWEKEIPTSVTRIAEWSKDGSPSPLPLGAVLPAARFPILSSFKRDEPRIFSDVANDLTHDPNARDLLLNTLHVQSMVIYPVITNEQWIGVMVAESHELSHFDDEDIRYISALVVQASNVIGNIRLLEETQKRADELETVAQVSAATTSILDIDKMLLAVTDLTKDSFGLYHAHVYLMDETGENLVLAAGAGEPGRIMKAEGRSIAINHPNSLVAHAASTREGTIANDVTQAPDFLPNPLLPNTKSELAVPMVVGDKLIGVLDVQSGITNRFSEDDVRIQGTLADQIAVAVENARAFARAEQLVVEMQSSSQLVRTVIDTIPDWIWVKRSGDYRMVLANKSIAEEGFGSTPEYITNKTEVELGVPDYIIHGDPERGIRGWRTDDDEVLDEGKTLYNPRDVVIRANDGVERIFETTKIPLRDQTGTPVGVVGYARDVTERKAQEEEQRILFEISRAMSNAHTPADVLSTMAGYAASRGANSASLFHIDTEEGIPTWIENVANETDGTIPTVDVGSRYYLPEFQMAKIWLADPTKPLLINDIVAWEQTDPTAYTIMKQLGTCGIAVIPLFAQERWVGLMTFSWHTHINFTTHDEHIFISAMRQATTTVDALRASALTAKRAAELQTVAQVSAAATMLLEVDSLLQSVVDLTKESFNLYHAHVYLIDESGENLVLTAGAGEPGRIMKEQGRSISVNHQNSLVARAARDRDGAIANDVTQAADFLPNPLLPDTRSEMAIPLIVGDDVIGVLDIQSDTINRFTADDVAIQSTLADQIAVAVQNARTFKMTQETAERLREVDRLKSQFLANMSHELRTPLNSIIGYAEVLLDGIDGDLSDEAVEDVEAIHGGGKHLLTIINDILDLAKIEAGQMFMDRQDANLNQAVDEAVNTCQILAKNKNIGLNVELDGDIPHVFGDPIRLKQIIVNLVNNAIKFTEKGAVTVQLSLTNENNQVIVAVHDSGMGMTEEDLTGLFQQFHQVDGSATRRAGGTGLGLVITRHLVHMHEGEIYVESEKGAGSTFWFTLPVYTNQPRQRA